MFLNKLISPHLPAEPTRPHRHTRRAATKGPVVIAARFFAIRRDNTCREKAGLSRAEQGLGAGARRVSSSPPWWRCLRWRAACLDCAHWLEEYVASTVCGGSVFPGLAAWGRGTDGREENESREPLLGTRYQTLLRLDPRIARCLPVLSIPCRHQAVSRSIIHTEEQVQRESEG